MYIWWLLKVITQTQTEKEKKIQKHLVLVWVKETAFTFLTCHEIIVHCGVSEIYISKIIQKIKRDNKCTVYKIQIRFEILNIIQKVW